MSARAGWFAPFRIVRNRFAGEAGGSVSIVAAFFGVAMVASLAIGVDVGSVYLQRRSQQGALDIAAIAAARDLSVAEKTARLMLTQNGFADPGDLKVMIGRYDPDQTRDGPGRFVAGGAPSNAVRLVMTKPAPLRFGRALMSDGVAMLRTTSIAVNTRVAAFNIGSRLVSLQGGIANALLSKMLGAQVSLTAMDYNALASATVDTPDLLRALPPRMGVTAATYDDVLSLTPTLGQMAQALSDASSGTSGSRSALSAIAQANPTKRVNLRQMFSVGPFSKLPISRPTGVSATASVLDMLFTGVGIANGSNQVDVDLGAQVPGLLGLTASIAIGERPQASPWLAMGVEQVSVRTAQTRVRLVASVGGPLGLPALKLPLAIDVAAGQATLSVAQCGANPRSDAQASLAVTPSLVEMWVGEPTKLADWNALITPAVVGNATVLDTLLLTATASAHVAATNVSPRIVTFSASDIATQKVKTVETTDIAQTTLTSLVGNLSVGVQLKLLGLSLGTPQAVSAALAATLRPVGALIDPVLNDTLRLLGVGLGEADVTVRGLRCDGSTLVM